jgi:hypothetical protein
MLTTLRADHGLRHGLNILSMFDMQSFPIRAASNHCRVLSDCSYNRLTPAPIVGPGRRPTMACHVPFKETIMPSEQDHKGKGKQGRNYDELNSAGNQRNSDLASGPGDNAQRGDQGNLQSGNLDQGNQSQSDLGSGPGDNSQRGSRGGGNMQCGGQGSRSGRNRLTPDDLDTDESL